MNWFSLTALDKVCNEYFKMPGKVVKIVSASRMSQRHKFQFARYYSANWYALPSVAASSATWPRCLWSPPVPGVQRWWQSHSSGCWGWCGDSADGSARGVVGGGGRLPHDPGPYSRVVSTTALYTLILLPFFTCLLLQTLLYNLPKVLFALASLLSISLSILTSDEMVPAM